jgi:hypothetical protein
LPTLGYEHGTAIEHGLYRQIIGLLDYRMGHCVVYKQIKRVVIGGLLCCLPVELCILYNTAAATAKTVYCSYVDVYL